MGAPDGERGLAVIRSENPDLVVLDVMMPERPSGAATGSPF
jgi:DNA-binding response OmpR family regulator